MILKANLKLFISMILLYVLVVSSNTSFTAAVFPGKYNNSIANLRYYVAPNYFSAYPGYGTVGIPRTAIQNWMIASSNTATPIRMYYETNGANAQLLFFVSTNINYPASTAVLAHTEHWSSKNTYISGGRTNWQYAKIYLNYQRLTVASYGLNRVIGTATHEVGHALGLAHTSNRWSIMCQTGSGRIVQTPTHLDTTDVTNKYKKKS